MIQATFGSTSAAKRSNAKTTIRAIAAIARCMGSNFSSQRSQNRKVGKRGDFLRRTLRGNGGRVRSKPQ